MANPDDLESLCGRRSAPSLMPGCSTDLRDRDERAFDTGVWSPQTRVGQFPTGSWLLTPPESANRHTPGFFLSEQPWLIGRSC